MPYCGGDAGQEREERRVEIGGDPEGVLKDASHRIRFVYVPKHTSWLNQVEIWFSVLTRRALKRGNFRSKADLRDRILKFIDYFNQTMVKPYK